MNKVVKEAALKFAVLWFSQIPFRTSSLYLHNTLDASTSFNEPMITLSNVAILQCITEICQTMTEKAPSASFRPSPDFFATYSLGIILRLQHSSAVSIIEEELRAHGEGEASKVLHQTARATQLVLQAAIDLLALSCISMYIIEGTINGRRFDIDTCKSNPSIVIFLNSDSLDLGSLSKQMELELMKRVRSFSFPSLMQESTFEVSMRLIEQIESFSDGNAENRRPGSGDSTGTEDASATVITHNAASVSHERDALLQQPKYRSKSSDLSQRFQVEDTTLAHSTTVPTLIDLFAIDGDHSMQCSAEGGVIGTDASPRVAPPMTVRNSSFDRHKLRSLKQTKANSYNSGLITAMNGPSSPSQSGKFDPYLEEPRVVGPPKASPLTTPARKTLHSPQISYSPEPILPYVQKSRDREVGGRSDNVEASAMTASTAALSSSLISTLSSDSQALSPGMSAASDSYIRAASARVKRSRLKNLHHIPIHQDTHLVPAPLQLDPPLEVQGDAAEWKSDSADKDSELSGRTPVNAYRQSLPSPNVRNREIRKMVRNLLLSLICIC